MRWRLLRGRFAWSGTVSDLAARVLGGVIVRCRERSLLVIRVPGGLGHRIRVWRGETPADGVARPGEALDLGGSLRDYEDGLGRGLCHAEGFGCGTG